LNQHRREAPRGFTLLEMLVVVVIIGLVTAGAIISLGATGRDGQLEQERDRLTALIGYVQDRGEILTLDYGILCGRHGYRFVYYDGRTQQWLPETLDDTLRERKLPSGLSLRLVVEGHTVVLDDQALKFDSDAASKAAKSRLDAPLDLNGTAPSSNAPQIMLLSDGDTNSFALSIERESAHRSVTVQSGADGEVHAGAIAQVLP